MDVEPTPIIPGCLSSLDPMDGGLHSESENNNQVCNMTSMSSSKNMFSQKGFIENNVSFASKASVHEDSNDSNHNSKSPRTSPQGSDLSNSEGHLIEEVQEADVIMEKFTNDIICNIDGTVYIVPCNLSSRLLAPNGILNEVTDAVSLPFPVSAKNLYYYNSKDTTDQKVYHFTLTEFSSVDSQTQLPTSPDHTLLMCVPCRKHFPSLSFLIAHASSEHQLAQHNSWSDMPAATSAILFKNQSQSLTLSFMWHEEAMTVESLLSKDLPSERSTSRSSSSPASSLFFPTQKSGTTNGCDEHPDGGIECPKCDLVLSSSRSLGGHMTMMHSRNSCKTLKCPKCNWHYKYQETLEIHMKEKHPDTEQTCIYCVTKQAHPKLSRGETYMCGYKPYRCDICNYSTTTKGNLSIHMQSDKHINNMQEMHQSPVATVVPLTPTQQEAVPPSPSTAVTSPSAEISLPPLQSPTPSSCGNKAKQQKNTWRCDVCNYETNIARNLRIHMTSEKHTHNMLILQQNVKSMQRNMNMTIGSLGLHSGQADAAALQQLGTMFPFDPLGIVGQIEAISQGGETDISKVSDDLLASQSKRSKDVYGCVICNVFTTDDLNQLENHLSIDRSSTTNAEHVTITPENQYLCNLCQYKTNLKANFQLHCKTDKHVQRVQLVNHIREGGADNEWRMKYLSIPNPVHIICNVCTYQSNSIHKMRIHSLSPSHSIGASLFSHLRQSDELTNKYHQCCGICGEQTTNKIAMVNHVRLLHATSMQELHNEGWQDFTVRAGSPDIRRSSMDVDGENSLSSDAKSDNSERGDDSLVQSLQCSDCSFAAPSVSVLRKHMSQRHASSSLASHENPGCPLCSSSLSDFDALEGHLFTVHNVNKEGAQRLISLVDTSSWKPKDDSETEDFFRCQTCTKTFADFDKLCQHQNELEHFEVKMTPRGPGYLCFKKGCNQYFKSAETLQTHFQEIHIKQKPSKLKTNTGNMETSESSAVECFVCHNDFPTTAALKSHLEVVHFDSMSSKEMEMYKRFMTTGLLPQVTPAEEPMDTNESDLVIDEEDETFRTSDPPEPELKPSPMLDMRPVRPMPVLLTSPIIRTEPAKKDDKPYKCIVCNVAYGSSHHLDEHLRAPEHLLASAKITGRLNHQSHLTPPAHLQANGDYPKPKASAAMDTAAAGCLSKQQSSLEEKTSRGEDDSIRIASYSEEIKISATSQHKPAADTSLAASSEVNSDSSHMQLKCSRCSRVFSCKDLLVDHQKLCSGVGHTITSMYPRARTHRSSKSSPFKQLLQNYEGSQQKSQPYHQMEDSMSESGSAGEEEEQEDIKSSPTTRNLLPEVSRKRLTCSECGQRFSGIWVLKAHKEEEHGQVLPETIIDHFGNLYKEEYEKNEKEAAQKPKLQSVSTEEKVTVKSEVTAVSSPSVSAGKHTPIKSEISTSRSIVPPTSFTGGSGGNPMDMFTSYSAASSMNPWLSLLPFAAMMPNSMLNTMVPSVPAAMTSTHQSVNSLVSPTLLTSPTLETTSRPHSITTPNSQQEKRARTRISDDQLKVLRQYFDINNSPNEDAIMVMANKTQLPPKVIKHWFRNTLFKERQKNKDSPYNFENPPQTTLNLEEYEKTGKVQSKTTAGELSSEKLANHKPSITTDDESQYDDAMKSVTPPAISHAADEIEAPSRKSSAQQDVVDVDRNSNNDGPSIAESDNDSSMMSPGSPMASVCSDSMNSSGNAFSRIFSSPPYRAQDFQSSSANSKRANRTRFTDFQIKTLQDYFDQNAYPKDDELDRLSRVLQLSNRVIVVWFQNARQKARKVYENNPTTTSEANPSQASKPTSYPCKKCGVVFSGYYDLVKHQKRVCLKNDIVPLPFGNQEGTNHTPSPAKERPDSVSAEKFSDITKRANNKGLTSPESTSSSALNFNMAENITKQFQASQASMMNPFMSLTNMGGLPLPNAMKELYEQSIKKLMDESQQSSADVGLTPGLLAASGHLKLDNQSSSLHKLNDDEQKSQRTVSTSRRVSNSVRAKPEAPTSLPVSMLPGVSPSSSFNAGSTTKDNNVAQWSRNLLASLNPMMGLPGADMLSLMYPGLLPQMPLIPGLMNGGLGADQLGLSSLYNPLDFGTPLSLLQIPQVAIRSIALKVNDVTCSTADYTQDCMSLSDLKKEISVEDMALVKSSSVDVGYACRKCQFVFPRREACVNHQASTCFIGKKPSTETMLKIEQQQFTCKACSENLATVQEFKLHCSIESHKFMKSKYSNNNNNNSDLGHDAPAAKRLKIV